jgi:hypothetical protein
MMTHDEFADLQLAGRASGGVAGDYKTTNETAALVLGISEQRLLTKAAVISNRQRRMPPNS